MGLKKSDAGFAEERFGKDTERLLVDKGNDSLLQAFFCEAEKSLPFQTVCFKEFLPSIESSFRDVEGLTEFLHGAKMDTVLSKDAEDEEQAVLTVRNDRIGKNSVGGSALGTEEPRHAETGLHYMSGLDIDQLPVIVSQNGASARASTDRTGFRFGTKAACALVEQYFSGQISP